jgi:hypothetical protein
MVQVRERRKEEESEGGEFRKEGRFEIEEFTWSPGSASRI